MPRQLALFLCLAFVFWLFRRDRTLRPMRSAALWLPLIWLSIIGSRSVSAWFGNATPMESPEAYVEGSPLDRNIYLALIVAGGFVLARRGFTLRQFSTANRWLFAFFIYLGISSIWADHPFVSFKRWIKDVGHVIMTLIILTDGHPVQALRAVFARFGYLVIPLSAVLIKYYPELGTYYTADWNKVSCGVAVEKNALGCNTLIFGLFLAWDWIEARQASSEKMPRADLAGRLLLAALVLWLLRQSQSSTSLALFVLGAGIICCIRMPFARVRIQHLGRYTLIAAVTGLIFFSVPGVRESVVTMLGRDLTLTGRTDIWDAVLKEPINPLLGTGYQSFWIGQRAEKYWERWIFHPNQSHNGYIETYLNTGLLGLALLCILLITSGRNLRDELLANTRGATFRFSLFIVFIIYNWTEAMYDRMSPAWFVTLVAIMRTSTFAELQPAMATDDLEAEPDNDAAHNIAPLSATLQT